MAAQHWLVVALGCALGLSAAGCGWSPKQRLTAAENNNRTLQEQTRAQLAEIENLRAHAREVEQQLHETERELALIEEKSNLERKELASYRGDGPKARLTSAVIPDAIRKRLEDLTVRFPDLQFDPELGISKLEQDILFDSAENQLRPEAQQTLKQLVQVLESPEGKDLKLMVVGHTDAQNIARRQARQKYPNNWHLSTARSLIVADFLRQAGLSEDRLAVAGFGAFQPIASNRTPEDRARNRRVEVFVMPPDMPVVGWVETIPSMYQ
jgi:chemotaxis protein MotB